MPPYLAYIPRLVYWSDWMCISCMALSSLSLRQPQEFRRMLVVIAVYHVFAGILCWIGEPPIQRSHWVLLCEVYYYASIQVVRFSASVYLPCPLQTRCCMSARLEEIRRSHISNGFTRISESYTYFWQERLCWRAIEGDGVKSVSFRDCGFTPVDTVNFYSWSFARDDGLQIDPRVGFCPLQWSVFLQLLWGFGRCPSLRCLSNAVFTYIYIYDLLLIHALQTSIHGLPQHSSKYVSLSSF